MRTLYFKEIEVSPDTGCHQGVTSDGTYYYCFHTDSIVKFDSDWNVVTSNTGADTDAGVSHIGDGFYYDSKLYIASEDFSSCSTFSNMRISVFNSSDLSFVENIDISAQGHECSSACLDTDNDIVYVSSFCASSVDKYSFPSFSFVETITLSPSLLGVQGVTYKDGVLYFSADPLLKIVRCDLSGNVSDTVLWAEVNEGIDFSTDKMLAMQDQVTKIVHVLELDTEYTEDENMLTIRK